MYLYHVNVGFPVVDEGSELLAPARNVAARGEYPAEGYETLHAPEAGYVEQVFEHELASEDNGTVPVAIVNREAGLGLYQLYDSEQFPHHRSEEHTSELQSRQYLVCRLLLEKKKYYTLAPSYSLIS